jgi:hypothetical protein
MKINKIKILRKRSFKAAIFLLGLFLSLASCKKNKNVGLAVQPEDELLEGDGVIYTDIRMKTIQEDSVQTSGLSKNILGEMNDPVLGSSKSAIYSQFSLTANNVSFEDDSVWVDSVVLVLKYDDYYGYEDNQTFGVYEITESGFSSDSTYRTFDNLTVDPTNLIEPGFENQEIDPTGNVIVGNDTLSPQLRIRLKNSLGESVLYADESTQLSNDDQFLEFFKGAYITPENNSFSGESGAMLYFDLEDANQTSGIYIYYSEQVDGDTLSKIFQLRNDGDAHFHSVTHDYASAPIGPLLDDETAGNTAAYIQSLAGLKIEMSFPELDQLKDSSNIAVNRAELILPASYFQGSNFFPNQTLIVRDLDNNGNEGIALDQTISIIAGQTYDEDNANYTIVLTRHVQQVLRGELANNPIRIVTSSAAVTANKVAINGKNALTQQQPKLVISYSKY